MQYCKNYHIISIEIKSREEVSPTMKIEFTITTPRETRKFTRVYSIPTPEYAIADDAYIEALRYLTEHNLTTLDDLDYDYKEVIEQ